MGLGGIKIIECNKGCGMTLFALDLTKRLAKTKSIKSVGVFKAGSYKVYDKEEFLKDCVEALGGKG